MEAISDSVKNIHGLFSTKGLTLSAAESCTGGLVSHCITDRPGASMFFKGAVVAYSAEMKESVLGVSPETMRKHGVVSRETACEMAEKIRLLANTDCSVSATGNLGPDVLESKEKGEVYIAASIEGRTISKKLMLTGDRKSNKEEASHEALNLILELYKD